MEPESDKPKVIDQQKRNPTKAELIEFVNKSLKKIKEIDQAYQKLKEGSEDAPSIITDIEDKYEKIIAAYKNLFDVDESGVKKITELNEKYEVIKQYHKQLLEGDGSIQADIKESQDRITEFYVSLFGNDEKEGSEKKVKDAIKHITEFYEGLISEEGIKKKIDQICQDFIQKYNELFIEKENDKTKVEKLGENIDRINNFDERIKSEIEPKIEEKQSYLEKVQREIESKKKDVDALLQSSTGGALAEGYRESMEEYSKKTAKIYKTGGKAWGIILQVLTNIEIFFFNNLFRHFGQIINYAIFILPLLGICLIFINPNSVARSIGYEDLNGHLRGAEFITYRTIISIPLFWIAWFGQQNISKRRRLFEEYNHKLRVSQMYLLFTQSSSTYNFAKRERLENALLRIIKSNPAKYLGSGGTFIDKLLQTVYLPKIFGQLKKQTGILNDLKGLEEKDQIK